MARVIFLTGMIMTFAVGTVVATETGMLMPVSASSLGD